jgi:hypothetical protein
MKRNRCWIQHRFKGSYNFITVGSIAMHLVDKEIKYNWFNSYGISAYLSCRYDYDSIWCNKKCRYRFRCVIEI